MGKTLIVPWTASLKKRFLKSAELTAQESMVFSYLTKTHDIKRLCYITGYDERTVQEIIDSIAFKYDCVRVQNQGFPPRFKTQEDLQSFVQNSISEIDTPSTKEVRERVEKLITNEKKRTAMIRKLCDGATYETIASELDMSVNGVRKMIQAGKNEIGKTK